MTLPDEDSVASKFQMAIERVPLTVSVETAIDAAVNYIRLMYDASSLTDPTPKTPSDYDVIDMVTIDGVSYSVDWTSDTDLITFEKGENHRIIVKIPEENPAMVYNLIATVMDSSGLSKRVLIPHSLTKKIATPTYEEIVEMAYDLPDGRVLNGSYVLYGKVIAIPTPYSEQYGNITVNIQVGDLSDYPIQCYRLSGDGCENIKIGDYITVEGEIKNYKGTIEFNKPRLIGYEGSSAEPEDLFMVSADGVLSVNDKSLISGGIVLPDTVGGGTVTAIKTWAFSGCSGLTSITIPDTVTKIGDRVFHSCSGLTSVSIPKTVTSIGTYAFKYCQKLTSITVDPENSYYVSVDGVLYNKDMTEIICYPANKTGSRFEVPGTVTSIGESAFDSCWNLTEVVLPDSVTYIGVRAFEGCLNLASINLPDSLLTIEHFAFLFCESLTSIEVPASVTSIGDNPSNGHYSKKINPFNDCYNLTNLTVDSENDDFISVDNVLYNKSMTELICYSTGKTDASFTIPDSVIDIGCYSFDGCGSLTSLIIPGSVTVIGGYSLCWCDNLSDIRYAGTKTQWDLVNKEEGWNHGVPATIVHCSDGDVEIGTTD